MTEKGLYTEIETDDQTLGLSIRWQIFYVGRHIRTSTEFEDVGVVLQVGRFISVLSRKTQYYATCY